MGLWCSRVFYFGSGSVLVCIFLRRASKILILQSMVHFDIFLAPSIFSESLLSGSRLSWDSPFFRQGYWAPPGSHWSVAKFNLSSRHAQPLACPTLFWALVLFAPFLGFPWPLGPFFGYFWALVCASELPGLGRLGPKPMGLWLQKPMTAAQLTHDSSQRKQDSCNTKTHDCSNYQRNGGDIWSSLPINMAADAASNWAHPSSALPSATQDILNNSNNAPNNPNSSPNNSNNSQNDSGNSQRNGSDVSPNWTRKQMFLYVFRHVKC